MKETVFNPLGSTIETSEITDGNVTAAKLASNAVETAKIKDANVTTAKIAANNVTSDKLSAAVRSGLGIALAFPANNHATITKFISIVACSATTWVATDGTSTYQSTDSGATWTAKDDKITGPAGIVACRADPTKLICFSYTNHTTSFSADSGATWTIETTTAASANTIRNIDYPTTTLAVMHAAVTGSTGGFRCTDPGTALNWAVATSGPNDTYYGIHMLDGTNGWAVSNVPANGTILVTSNAGVDWADSTHDTADNTLKMAKILAIDATHIIIARDSKSLEFYTGSANSTYKFLHNLANYSCSNGCKITNGNCYFVFRPSSGVTDPSPIILFKSTDSGATWTQHVIGLQDSTIALQDSQWCGESLTEYDTNKLLYGYDNFLVTIDES